MHSSQYYPEGHLFFEEGSEGTSAYIIKSGRVEITTQQGNKKIVIAAFGRGEIFGEMALLGAQTRTASAKVTEKTEAISINRANLLRSLQKVEPIVRHIVSGLINRIQQTTGFVHPEKADDFSVGVCRLLVLIANQKSNSANEDGNTLLPYAETIEQIEEILSIDASDCEVILEELEAVNLIEIVQNQLPKDKSIRLIDGENFLHKAIGVLKELEAALSDRLTQESICIDLYDLSEQIGVEREKIRRKISEGEVPVELFFLKKDDVLKWVQDVGPSFFEEEKKRISAAEDLDSLDAIVYVKNALLRAALTQIDFHKTCLLVKTASETVKDKIMTNLSGRIKQVVEHEMDLIEEVDADELEEATGDFLDEIKDLMAEQESKRDDEKSEEESTDEAEKDDKEDVEPVRLD